MQNSQLTIYARCLQPSEKLFLRLNDQCHMLYTAGDCQLKSEVIFKTSDEKNFVLIRGKRQNESVIISSNIKNSSYSRENAAE